MLKPVSFAGLFGAAPSIALATLGLTIASKGRIYAADECRSMMLGAIALGAYCWLVSCLLVRHKLPAPRVTSLFILFWLAAALGLWFVVPR